MKLVVLLPFLFLGSFQQGAQAQNCQPVRLSIENLINPTGIDAPAPRFKWQISDARQGALQTACRIRLGTDSAAVANGHGSNWDTGIVQGGQMQVCYAGKTPLIPLGIPGIKEAPAESIPSSRNLISAFAIFFLVKAHHVVNGLYIGEASPRLAKL